MDNKNHLKNINDQNFAHFMRGYDKGGYDKGFYGSNILKIQKYFEKYEFVDKFYYFYDRFKSNIFLS